MRVFKDTPFEFSMMPWELEPPRTSLMLVVKATFDLRHKEPCVIAEEQVTCLGEVPWEDGESPSLRTETDYAVFKPRGEWYLTGHAHAVGPPVPVTQVDVSIGSLQKRLAVFGDRYWKRGVLGSGLTAPVPFQRTPLRWERSFGGPSFRENPVGSGLVAQVAEDGSEAIRAPNLEDPRHPIASRNDRPKAAGMFAIPSLWPERTRHIGTYDEVWKVSRWPYFPRDFRMEFFQAAPVDQRLPADQYWRGDEAIELMGLHPEYVHLRTHLPGLRPRVFVERVTRPAGAPPLELMSSAELRDIGRPKTTEVQMRLDTIVVDSDQSKVICTFRGLVEVADAKLSDVERLFFVHEPLGEKHPHAYYEDWLLRKVIEQAAEFEFEDHQATALVASTEPDPDPIAELMALDPKTSDEALVALGRMAPHLLASLVEPSVLPTHEEYRERLREAGIDPDEILPPLEIVEAPAELDEPPSFLRLVAIVRRRLGKPFRDLDLTRSPYRGLNLSGVDFSGSRMTDADLSGANLTGCKFDGAVLDRAKLVRALAPDASFRETDLTEVDGTEARFERSCFDGAVSSHATFSRAIFFQCSLVAVDFAGAALDVCDLRETMLDRADFDGANIEGAGFVNSSMKDTSLEKVRGARAVFDRCRMHDLRAAHADFSRARFVLVDAERAQFQESRLVEVDFSGSNLASADFADAIVARSNFVRVSAAGAIFDRADARECLFLSAGLFEASFQDAKLSNADLRGAQLFSANFYRTELHGTQLDGANLERTYLEGR